MTFHVGQKVVCVDASCAPGLRWDVGEAPVEGQVYTIAGVRKSVDPARYDGLVLCFSELPRSERVQHLSLTTRMGVWAGYAARRFRPVVERKTDISGLQALLNTKSIDELVS